MITKTFTKAPTEVLDYQIDWTDFLGTDTINTSVWAVTTGVTVDSDTETSTIATVWLSGGTDGTVYTITNTIVTTGLRTAVRSFYLSVEEK